MRIMLLTDKAIYIIDEKTFKLKHRLSLQQINMVVTKHGDNFALIRIPLDLIKDKGDLLLVVNNVIELATYLAHTVQDKNIIYISCKERCITNELYNNNIHPHLHSAITNTPMILFVLFRLQHHMIKGKSGFIDIKNLENCEPGLVITRKGHLIIVSNFFQ